MKKRMIALFLALAMLVPFTPAVAADDNVPLPTVEEILSEYHQKAFEAEVVQQTGRASANSRSAGGSGKTLEQETVATLNAAGYEAYNVTSDNYKTLEKQLQTDFSEMGLDSDASYIITISGEENSAGNNARGPSLDVVVDQALDGGPTYFEYTYGGTTYKMRYVTVTAADQSSLSRSFHYYLTHEQFPETWNEILDAILMYTVDSLTEHVPIASIFSLMSDVFTDDNYVVLETNQLTISGNTLWTLKYIQVYDSNTGLWISSQSSESAESRALCHGYLYNESNNRSEFFVGNEAVFTRCSVLYNNASQRKLNAVQAYLARNISRDFTGDIDFYLKDSKNEISFTGSGQPLFTQLHWFY